MMYNNVQLFQYFYGLSIISKKGIIASEISTVMWIRIDCMRLRIHKIWWMRIRIRIQTNKITKFSAEKKYHFQICT